MEHSKNGIIEDFEENNYKLENKFLNEKLFKKLCEMKPEIEGRINIIRN